MLTNNAGEGVGEMDYTTEELMVIAAAREIRDKDVVFVGMRLPMLAFAVGQKTACSRRHRIFRMRDRPGRAFR